MLLVTQREQHTTQRPSVKKTAAIITVSLGAHLALIFLLNANTHMVRTVKSYEPPQIKATLVFTPPKPNKVTPKPVSNQPVEKTPKQALPQEEITNKPLKSKPIVGRSLSNSAVNPKEKLQKKPTRSAIIGKKQDSKLNKIGSADAILNATRGYLQNQKMELGDIYSNHRASTSLMTGQPMGHDYQPVHKTEEQKRLVKITCDSGAKKALAMLSGFMKGTVVCNAAPDLSSFLPKAKN